MGPEPMPNQSPTLSCQPAYCEPRQAATGWSVATWTVGPIGPGIIVTWPRSARHKRARATPIPAAPVDADAIPTAERFEELAKTDVLACFRAAIARYHRDVPVGYTALMRKHERINGRMHAPENVEVTHRNNPQSTFMKWISAPAGQADRVLYVEGANDNQMICRPSSAIARAIAGSAVLVDPYGRDAKGGGRVAV